MKYILYTVILLLVLIAVAVGIVSLIERRKPKEKRVRGIRKILLCVAVDLLLIVIAGAVYFGNYYHGDQNAELYMQGSETVTVTKTRNGYLFDGPSEEQAMIFYPGAKVEAEAYAPLLCELAEQWGDCFLVEMPLNMAVMDYDAAEEIQNNYNYDRWYLAGHSMGGMSAALYASEHEEELNGLFLLAAYSTKPIENDLLTCSIYGDCDQILNREEYEDKRENLPEGSVEVVIPGGNHAQFGSYGKQRGDGEASISAQQQWDAVVQAVKIQTETA